MAADLPDKQYFRIGEVARLTALKPSVLRFWETEFKELQPPKSRTGQRLYTRRDIAVLLEIKQLLYGEKLTIEGARNRLLTTAKRQKDHQGDSVQSDDLVSVLREVRHELEAIRIMLQK
ncbi:MAG: MerR family transcriptional regulator [Desulfuromonadales bacterium]|nr:MAG: MerR family transcriptional regulator [Desulfuromonadales bacterium]